MSNISNIKSFFIDKHEKFLIIRPLLATKAVLAQESSVKPNTSRSCKPAHNLSIQFCFESRIFFGEKFAL